MSDTYEAALVALLRLMAGRGMGAGEVLRSLPPKDFSAVMMAVTASPAVKEAAELLMKNEVQG